MTAGAVEPTSQVYVPSDPAFGTEALSQEAPNAASHGTVTDLTYDDPESTNPVGKHYVAVYTPPGYDAHRAPAYPTLYICTAPVASRPTGSPRASRAGSSTT